MNTGYDKTQRLASPLPIVSADNGNTLKRPVHEAMPARVMESPFC